MKRYNNLFDQICHLDNLVLADQIARKGKSKQHGVIVHDKNRDANILQLHHMLLTKTFTTSSYKTFVKFDQKERLIFCLPYFPDRILHHAVMNILEPIFVSTFTADTYSCIKGRGIHAAQRNLKRALRDADGTKYCLKLDIKKFYPSIDHDVLKSLLRRKFKDQNLLWLLDNIIDSAEGVPIGNYLSQYFANFYLTYFDHWLKETKSVKYYFRYADDIVILAGDKPYLHALLADIRAYLSIELKLQVKSNYQVFPVKERSIDFVGYRFYHTHIMLRKSIKKAFARAARRRNNRASIVSYMGWAKHCNSKNLVKRIITNESIQRIGGEIENPVRRENKTG